MNFNSWRYRTAFWFGRKEHFFSRLLFGCLLITYGLFRLKMYDTTNILLIIDIALWILYWLCHRAEKIAHPNH